MTSAYWPWWLGGIGLATVALAYPLLNGAPLGVSGALARLVSRRRPQPQESSCAGSAPTCEPNPPTASPSPRRDNLAFLGAMILGGTLAGWIGGQTWGTTDVSPDFHRLFGHGPKALVILFAGGVLVGFGTRTSGGCTSGHGLSGCGRLQPASLLATATFFGLAILTSFILEFLLK